MIKIYMDHIKLRGVKYIFSETDMNFD